jgi:hypothetical protein
MWAGDPLYDAYLPGQQYWGIDPLTDQGTAGVIMMAESGIVTLAIICLVLLRWAQRDFETQRLLELAEREGVPLSPERAERAVAAGHGGLLEERLKRH